MRIYLIRGVPGSGKSSLAQTICGPNGRIFEADQFFVEDGEYQFDIDELFRAHLWCFSSFREAIISDLDTVIVSGTFLTIKKLRPYVKECANIGIMPQIITCEANFGDVHNVPDYVKERHKQRFDYRAGEVLLKEYFSQTS